MRPPFQTGAYVEYFDGVVNEYLQARVVTGRYDVAAVAWQFVLRRADNVSMKVYQQLMRPSTSTKFLLTMPTHLIH